MKTKIIIPGEYFLEAKKGIRNRIYNELIKKDNIDTDFYYIKIDKVMKEETVYSLNLVYIILYSLIRKEIGDDLEKTKIGL